MDFIEGLPRSNGFMVVVVDRLSKDAHFIPLRHPYTTMTVVAAFMREVVRLHGISESIMTDQDKGSTISDDKLMFTQLKALDLSDLCNLRTFFSEQQKFEGIVTKNFPSSTSCSTKR